MSTQINDDESDNIAFLLNACEDLQRQLDEVYTHLSITVGEPTGTDSEASERRLRPNPARDLMEDIAATSKVHEKVKEESVVDMIKRTVNEIAV